MLRFPCSIRSPNRASASRFARAGRLAVIAACLLAAGGVACEAAREKAVKGDKADKARPPEAQPQDRGPATSPGAQPEAGGARQPAPIETPAPTAAPVQPAATPPAALAPPRETIDADVSVRSVAVTSAFTGTEVVLFGAINNARPQTSRTDVYDIVVVFEGSPTSLMVRRKSNVAGIWLNSSSVRLDRAPSYYAIASTRPLPEIAVPETLRAYRIGFDYVQIEEAVDQAKDLDKAEVAAFKQAATQLKRKEGVYHKSDYGVSFIGRSLFRAAIQLPANVPVGQLTARVHLFRNGEMLAQSPARVMLARQGIERTLHAFAFGYPLWYGLAAVALAVVSGLAASALFNRRSA